VRLLTAALLWLSCCMQVALADPHLRVLAASCAACHGTDGNSVGGTPVLAGLDRTYFVKQMQAFRSGDLPSTVMHRHAKGLTETEIDQLADYFSMQPRYPAALPSPPTP
jgi:cytochrome subunit of sulfide dehydrogenase